MMNEEIKYPGKELELFSEATNWKQYLSACLSVYVEGDVLEVGAGIGSMTKLLRTRGRSTSWTMLEPDPAMAQLLTEKISSSEIKDARVVQGTLKAIQGLQFDTIIYIDVLEHIEDDNGEIVRASSLLRPGGRLVVLSPAWQFLFSPFDKAIGHHRRYSRRDIKRLQVPSLSLLKCRYFDSMGALAALMNRLVLKQAYPNRQQILFWDRFLVPVSRILDIFLFYLFGKSILFVWEKPAVQTLSRK